MTQRITDNRAFTSLGTLRYLEDQDRYLGRNRTTEFSFGFIGTGIMGVEHIRNTLLEGRARIGGLFDPAPRSIEHALTATERGQPGDVPTVYASLEEACQDPATDALVIATPNYTHLEVLRTAIKSGKAILLEKPIATRIEDALEICRLADTHKVTIRTGMQYRYKAVYAEAIAEALVRRSLGEIRQVTMLEHRFPFLDKVSQWNKFNEFTGGTLVEKCCHYFDLINLFAASTPEQIFASGSQAVNFKDFTYDNRRADGLDQAQVIINYESGVIGGFSLCMFTPGTREELVVCGDAGRLHAVESAELGAPNQNRLQLWLGENGVSRESAPAYPEYIARAGHHGSTFFEHVEFVEDLKSGRSGGPALADAFWAVVVGATAQQSIAQRTAIDVQDMLPNDFEPEALATA